MAEKATSKQLPLFWFNEGVVSVLPGGRAYKSGSRLYRVRRYRTGEEPELLPDVEYSMATLPCRVWREPQEDWGLPTDLATMVTVRVLIWEAQTAVSY